MPNEEAIKACRQAPYLARHHRKTHVSAEQKLASLRKIIDDSPEVAFIHDGLLHINIRHNEVKKVFGNIPRQVQLSLRKNLHLRQVGRADEYHIYEGFGNTQNVVSNAEKPRPFTAFQPMEQKPRNDFAMLGSLEVLAIASEKHAANHGYRLESSHEDKRSISLNPLFGMAENEIALEGEGLSPRSEQFPVWVEFGDRRLPIRKELNKWCFRVPLAADTTEVFISVIFKSGAKTEPAPFIWLDERAYAAMMVVEQVKKLEESLGPKEAFSSRLYQGCFKAWFPLMPWFSLCDTTEMRAFLDKCTAVHDRVMERIRMDPGYRRVFSWQAPVFRLAGRQDQGQENIIQRDPRLPHVNRFVPIAQS